MVRLFFNIWPFSALKISLIMSQICQVCSAFCQIRNKMSKICQNLVNFCQIWSHWLAGRMGSPAAVALNSLASFDWQHLGSSVWPDWAIMTIFYISSPNFWQLFVPFWKTLLFSLKLLCLLLGNFWHKLGNFLSEHLVTVVYTLLILNSTNIL